MSYVVTLSIGSLVLGAHIWSVLGLCLLLLNSTQKPDRGVDCRCQRSSAIKRKQQPSSRHEQNDDCRFIPLSCSLALTAPYDVTERVQDPSSFHLV